MNVNDWTIYDIDLLQKKNLRFRVDTTNCQPQRLGRFIYVDKNNLPFNLTPQDDADIEDNAVILVVYIRELTTENGCLSEWIEQTDLDKDTSEESLPLHLILCDVDFPDDNAEEQQNQKKYKKRRSSRRVSKPGMYMDKKITMNELLSQS